MTLQFLRGDTRQPFWRENHSFRIVTAGTAAGSGVT
jgi:hypothetical protein